MSPAPQRRFHPDEQHCLAFIENEKLSRRAELFLLQHPEVYRHLVDLAREQKAKGLDCYSIKTLWEVTRWKLGISLNNSYTSTVARLIMQREPDLRGFFETRKQTAA